MNTEHHNGKPQLPELPRSIEEKPIVYDDGHLQEIREIAALPPIHLSPDEIEFAISLFARGFARDCAMSSSGLSSNSPNGKIRTAQKICSAFQKRLSDRLRTCDPTSAVFAQSEPV